MMMAIWKFFWPVRAWWHKGLEVGDYFPDFTLNDETGRSHSLARKWLRQRVTGT